MNSSLDTSAAEAKAALSISYNDVMTTDEVREKFEVISFLAPFVMVKRKSDGAKGTLEFTHMPRFYFNFIAD
jgi:hypothetical protein